MLPWSQTKLSAQIQPHLAREVEQAVHEALGGGENLAAHMAQGEALVHLVSSRLDLMSSDKAKRLDQVQIVVQRQAEVLLLHLAVHCFQDGDHQLVSRG
jgi:hypothetical protein